LQVNISPFALYNYLSSIKHVTFCLMIKTKSYHKKHRYATRKNPAEAFGVFLLFFITLFTGCNNRAEVTEHRDYFDPIYARVDSLKSREEQKAFSILDSAYRAFPNPGVTDLTRKYDLKRLFYLQVKPDNQKALRYTDSMLLVLQEHLDNPKSSDFYSSILFAKGDIYFSLKDYERGFEYYARARQFVNDTLHKAKVYGYDERLARVLYSQGRYRLAAKYFSNAAGEAQKMLTNQVERFSIVQEQITNTGLAYNGAEMLDSAAYFYDSAYRYIHQYKDAYRIDTELVQRQLAVIKTDKARVLAKKGDIRTAEQLFKESIQVTAQRDPGFTQYALILLSTLYVDHNYLTQADSSLDQLRSSLQKLPDDKALQKYYRLKASLLFKMNRPQEAYTHLEKYISQKDSLEKREKQFLAQDVSNKVQDMEQTYRLNALQKKSERSSFYFFIAVIVTIMALVILLLVIYHLRRYARYNRQLQLLNEEVSKKNEDLQVAFASLEQSHNENTRIMRVVAHDLKNPISAIQNLTYSLLKQEHSESMKEILLLIKDACNNSLSLIKDLLSAKKKLDETKTELVDMRKLLQYCVELLQAKADEKNQRLLLETEDAVARLNRQKIWQVISNIITNAIKFSHHNSDISIRLQHIKERDSLLLSVKDHGIGIPTTLKDDIFQSVPATGRTGTSGEESYGFGLSISMKIVLEHHGKLWFESVQDQGSTFFVELPC